jgi:hypothetical protein
LRKSAAVDSSRNLGVRLNVYFRNSYLKLQSNRSSAICRAFFKDAFAIAQEQKATHNFRFLLKN